MGLIIEPKYRLSVVGGGAGLPRIQVCWLLPEPFCPPQDVRGVFIVSVFLHSKSRR